MAEIVPFPSQEPPPFPLEVLPDAAQNYCEFLAEGGLPTEFLGPTALTLMAAAIGGLVSLQIGEGYWDEPLMIWTLTVGVTGSGKSPAVKNLRRALDEVESPWRRQFREQLQDWQALPKKEREANTKPLAKRLVIADATYEKTVRLLAEEPNKPGLLLIADEFASMVRGLNQYKNGSGADRANFLTIWTAQPLNYDRVGNDISFRIDRPVISILGGTQPHLLGTLTGDDGFRDRFLISVYDKPIAEEEEMPAYSGEAERWKLLIQRLAEYRDRPRVRFLSSEAKERWKSYRRAYRQIQNNPDTPSHLVGWTAKASSHLARLALLLSEADGRGEVDAEYLQRAASLIRYFGAHYRQLDLDAPNPMLPYHRRGEDQAVKALVDYLRKRPGRWATKRDLHRARVGGIRTSSELQAAIQRYGDTYEGHVYDGTPPDGRRQQTTVLHAPGTAPSEFAGDD